MATKMKLNQCLLSIIGIQMKEKKMKEKKIKSPALGNNAWILSKLNFVMRY